MRDHNDKRRHNRDEGKSELFIDVDRMVNEGLAGGIVSVNNGLIEETTTDSMEEEIEARENEEGGG